MDTQDYKYSFKLLLNGSHPTSFSYITYTGFNNCFDAIFPIELKKICPNYDRLNRPYKVSTQVKCYNWTDYIDEYSYHTISLKIGSIDASNTLFKNSGNSTFNNLVGLCDFKLSLGNNPTDGSVLRSAPDSDSDTNAEFIVKTLKDVDSIRITITRNQFGQPIPSRFPYCYVLLTFTEI